MKTKRLSKQAALDGPTVVKQQVSRIQWIWEVYYSESHIRVVAFPLSPDRGQMHYGAEQWSPEMQC